MKLLVSAGGQGTKLWPYSREDKPKQFQPIIGSKSLFAYNVETLLKRFAPEDILISTKRKFIKYVSEQTPQIPLRNYIIEPDIAKDRGPAEGYAFLKLAYLFPDEPFFMVQVDDIRKPEEEFLQMIVDAEKLVKRDKKFITGGIKATEPMLGVDYLLLGDQINIDTEQEIYSAKEFVDRKSNMAETRELVENFHIVVHCNHSCWYPNLMLDAYKTYRPDWYDALMKIKDVFDKPGEDYETERIYSTMEKGPTELVTKHIMPQAQIILLKFKWADIGTWSSLYEYFCTDCNDVYSDGLVTSVDSENTLIKTNNPNKLVAIAGVDNMVVVDTDDVLLIIPKEKLDKIKDLQKLIKDRDLTKYL